MFPPTRQEFLDAYKESLIRKYPWAADAQQLTNFLDMVRRRLDDTSSQTQSRWHYTGSLVSNVWKALGGTARPSLRQLRALSQEEHDTTVLRGMTAR